MWRMEKQSGRAAYGCAIRCFVPSRTLRSCVLAFFVPVVLISCDHTTTAERAKMHGEVITGIDVSSREVSMEDVHVIEATGSEMEASPVAAREELVRAFEEAASKRSEIRGGREAEKPIVVTLRGGIYYVDEEIRIGNDLSGTESSPTVLRSHPGETVIISGGIVLNDFRPVSDSAVRDRLSRAARRNVLEVDLPRSLVPDLGSLNPLVGRRPELYHDGRYAEPARYPNEGWLEIEDVPQTGERMIHVGLDRDTSAVPRGRHYGRFVYPGDRPSSWKKSDDIWVHGYWTWDWSDQFMRVAYIDKERREITPRAPHHGYGYTKGQRFYFLIVLEELDSPGEWYLDPRARTLYYWPFEKIEAGSVVFSVTSDSLLSIDSASHIRVESIEFRGGRGGGVSIRGGERVTVAGCVFRNFGRTAVSIDGGRLHTVSSCDVRDTGATGIAMTGGDRRTLEPGGHRAENNHIYRYAQRMRANRPAIQVGGVGNILSHNLVHHAPHMGFNIDGNEHVIEYNEIFAIAQETGDVGAMYMGRDWTERGTVFRYNFIHDLEGPGHVGAMGVYLDDAASGATIHRNVFFKAKRAILIGGGRDNLVTENVFAFCEPSIHIDARGIGWARNYIVRGGAWEMYRKLREVAYDEEPYASRYPALVQILDGNPDVPAGNVVIRNVSEGGSWLNLDSRAPEGLVRIEENDVDNLEGVASFLELLARRKPGDSIPARPEWFPDIPIAEIGLIEDEYRTW